MDTTINEVQYAQGFNDAYWIQMKEPLIAKELLSEEIDIKNDYLLGFKEGLAPTKEQTFQQELERLHNKDYDQSQDLDR